MCRFFDNMKPKNASEYKTFVLGLHFGCYFNHFVFFYKCLNFGKIDFYGFIKNTLFLSVYYQKVYSL